jgi:hypothetical protein
MKKRIKIRMLFCAGLCSIVAALATAPAHAQVNCTASQSAAIQCFVANAVTTDLTQPRFGMTLAQFEAYGVAVNQILQSNHTHLVLLGTASAIADAMPPTNADGTSNAGAQQTAVDSIVSAEVVEGLASKPPGVSLAQMQFFALDVVGAMNKTSGYMQLLTPGVGLRVIDSYIVTGTSNGAVNWNQLNANLSNFVNTFITAGLIKVPAGVTTAQVVAFVQWLARSIYNYKVATGRAKL